MELVLCLLESMGEVRVAARQRLEVRRRLAQLILEQFVGLRDLPDIQDNRLEVLILRRYFKPITELLKEQCLSLL